MPHIFQYIKPAVVVSVIPGTLLLSLGGNSTTADASSYQHSVQLQQALAYDTGNAIADSASFKFTPTSSASTTSVLRYAVGSEAALGTGDFTIEAWVYITSYGTVGRALIDFRPNQLNGFYPTLTVFTGGQLRATTNNAPLVTTAATLSLNTWHHVAWTRQSGTSRLFIDGAMQNTFADTNNYLNSGSIGIGSNAFYSTAPTAEMAGNMDAVQIRLGYAKYTSNFTPVTTY